MASWDAAIFGDDIAADVRDEYRDLLLDSVPDDEATGRVIATSGLVGTDEEPTLWLALAAAQHLAGRLDETVKHRALEVIDTGAGSSQGLRRLRDQLIGPQPPRKRLRRPTQITTDLVAGDVLVLTTPNGATAVLRVLRVERGRGGTTPVLGWVDAATPDSPIRDDSGMFQVADEDPRSPRPAVFSVLRPTKADLDWADAGFQRVGHVDPSLGDADEFAWRGVAWTSLASELGLALS